MQPRITPEGCILGTSYQCVLGNPDCCRLVDLKDFLGDDHLELPHLGELRVAAVLYAVEDFLAVNVDFQASFGVGRQLYSSVPGLVRLPKLRRQPRGDREIASRHAINNLDFYLPKLACHSTPPRRWAYAASIINPRRRCNNSQSWMPAFPTLASFARDAVPQLPLICNPDASKTPALPVIAYGLALDDNL